MRSTCLGNLRVYIQSMWVDKDPVSGKSVPELIAEIDAQLADRREFEEKLLSTGYSRTDSHRYGLKYRILELPLLFPESAVPRVKALDPGVSRIRYLATLDDSKALDNAEALALIMRLSM